MKSQYPQNLVNFTATANYYLLQSRKHRQPLKHSHISVPKMCFGKNKFSSHTYLMKKFLQIPPLLESKSSAHQNMHSISLLPTEVMNTTESRAQVQNLILTAVLHHFLTLYASSHTGLLTFQCVFQTRKGEREQEGVNST